MAESHSPSANQHNVEIEAQSDDLNEFSEPLLAQENEKLLIDEEYEETQEEFLKSLLGLPNLMVVPKTKKRFKIKTELDTQVPDDVFEAIFLMIDQVSVKRISTTQLEAFWDSLRQFSPHQDALVSGIASEFRKFVFKKAQQMDSPAPVGGSASSSSPMSSKLAAAKSLLVSRSRHERLIDLQDFQEVCGMFERSQALVRLFQRVIRGRESRFSLTNFLKKFLLLLFFPSIFIYFMYKSRRRGPCFIILNLLGFLLSLPVWMALPFEIMALYLYEDFIIKSGVTPLEIFSAVFFYLLTSLSLAAYNAFSKWPFDLCFAKCSIEKKFETEGLRQVLVDMTQSMTSARKKTTSLLGSIFFSLVLSLNPLVLWRMSTEGPYPLYIIHVQTAVCLISFCSSFLIFHALIETAEQMRVCLGALKEVSNTLDIGSTKRGVDVRLAKGLRLWLDMRTYAKMIAINPALSAEMYVLLAPLVLYMLVLLLKVFIDYNFLGLGFGSASIVALCNVCCFLFFIGTLLLLCASVNEQMKFHTVQLSSLKLLMVKNMLEDESLKSERASILTLIDSIQGYVVQSDEPLRVLGIEITTSVLTSVAGIIASAAFSMVSSMKLVDKNY